jgi:hypothetical protein
MEYPMRPHRAWRSSSPKNPARYFDCRGHFSIRAVLSDVAKPIRLRLFVKDFGNLQAVTRADHAMCEYLIVRLTTRRFGDIAPRQRKRVLKFPIRHFGSRLRKAGPSKTS